MPYIGHQHEGARQMTQHTPGPWAATGQDIVAEHLRETLSSGREVRLRIANAKDAGGALDLETVKANARLIAAAPELLAALKNVMLAHTADIETYTEGEFALEAWAQAEAAIARAEGEGK